MSKLFRVLGAAVLSAAAITVVAPSAHANSFSGSIKGGTYSYNDGADLFCVTASSSSTYVSADLQPTVASRGPSVTVSSDGRGRQCISLASAYEDTKYTGTIYGVGTTKPVSFYS